MYNMLWWHSCFGGYRYKWIFDSIENYALNPNDSTQIVIPLRIILNTWNPKDPRLLYLYKAVFIIRRKHEVYPIDLICKCMSSVNDGDNENNFIAWSIMEIMRQSIMHDDSLYACNVILRKQTMRYLHAWITKFMDTQRDIAIHFRIPYEKNVDKEIDKEIQRIRKDVQHKFDTIKTDINDRLLEADVSNTIVAVCLTGDASWVVFRNMAYLLLSVYNSIQHKCDISYITFTHIRHKLFLFLLPDDTHSDILLNKLYIDGSFLKNHIIESLTIVDNMKICDIAL